MDSSDEEYDSDGGKTDTEEEKEEKEKRVVRYGTIRFPSDGTKRRSGREFLSRFEKLALEQKPQDEEFCWLDTVAEREEGKGGGNEERE